MANILLGLIRRSYVYLDNATVKTLYTSLVKSIKKDCEVLENARRRATKLSE